MNFASFSLVTYTILAFGGMLYGASFNSLVTLWIGTLPGAVGLAGFTLYGMTDHARAYSETLRARSTQRRIDAMRANLARTGRLSARV